MNENLALNLTGSAARYSERPALMLDGISLSYAQLDDLTARTAALLRRRGLRAGDPVGVMLPNVPEFAIAYYGVLRAGGVVVPMNVLLKQREVAFYLDDPGAKLLIAWHEVARAAQAGAAQAGVECALVGPGGFESLLCGVAPDATVAGKAGEDTAAILYTSGTTGTPKGAQLTHANLHSNAEVTLRTLLGLAPEDVVLGALPLFHAFGQTCALNAAVAAGSALGLVPRFSPEHVLETIERERVTVFEGVPTMYVALINHAARERYDASSLRCCVSGGAALPVEVLRGFEQAFGCVVLEGYGLSETSPVACFNHPHRERIPGSIGTPIEGVQMRIVNDEHRALGAGETGEIAIRGRNVMKGYLSRPEATAEAIDADGWFYSGDIARTDADGHYFIVDRKKELIIRGGYNVYPREIEEVLYEHPAIREAAVVGVPHAELGEEVAAAVTLKPGAHASEAEVREFVRASVAAYKYPRYVWFVDELPKTSTGKIVKREITVPSELAGNGVALSAASA